MVEGARGRGSPWSRESVVEGARGRGSPWSRESVVEGVRGRGSPWSRDPVVEYNFLFSEKVVVQNFIVF